MQSHKQRDNRQRRLKVVIVSHAYLDPELRKNLIALSEYAEVTALIPRKHNVLLNLQVEAYSSSFAEEICRSFPTVAWSEAQFLFRSLTLELHRLKPDIINVEYNPWSLIFLQVLLCRALFCRNAKLVCTVKKNTYRLRPGWRGKLKLHLTTFCLKFVDLIFATSAKAHRLFVEELCVSAKRVVLVPHLGVDTDLFNPQSRPDAEARPVVIGYCGRFDGDKGLPELVHAVANAQLQISCKLELKLLGTGTMQDELDLLASNYSWLTILPPIPNSQVAGFFKELDIFVLPAKILPDHEEHDGRALIEALAAGLPCIGTKSGIIPELLADDNGIIVDSVSPEQLVNALVQLADEPKRRAEFGKRARLKAKSEFALRVVAERKMRHFERMLK